MENADLHELVKRIGPHLGSVWSYEAQKHPDEPLPHYAILRHRGGPGLSISTIWNETDRLCIHGTWPKTAGGEEVAPHVPYGEKAKAHRPEITVAIGRGPEAIAKAIQSRLLPLYLAKWDECAKLTEKKDQYLSKTNSLRDRLAAVVGVETPTGRSRLLENEFTAWPVGDDVPYVEVAVSADSASLHFHNLSPELAEKLLKVSKIKDKPRHGLTEPEEPQAVQEPDLGKAFP